LAQVAPQDGRVLAGGQSLVPIMAFRLAKPAHLVDINEVEGLDKIASNGKLLSIGARVRHGAFHKSVVDNPLGALLSEVARHIAHYPIRMRGTFCGSLAHADPSADYPAAVLALDADVVAMSTRGERIIPARDFFTGLFTTALAPDEVITEVRVPVTAPAATAYKKFAHPASGMAVVGVAVVVKMRAATIGNAAIGITGVGQFAYRATAVEKALASKSASGIPSACDFAADGVEVLGDYFASVEYRSHLARVYTRRAVQECVASVKK
jgi:carbon-monoxide dehydrogenase medium subunit